MPIRLHNSIQSRSFKSMSTIGGVPLSDAAEPMMLNATFRGFLLTAVVAVACVAITFSEKIQHNHGLGYDGAILAYMTKNFKSSLISDKQIQGDNGLMYPMDRHTISKVLPCAIVHFTFKALGISFSDQSIIRAFEFLNLLCLIGSVLIWLDLAAYFKLSKRQFWLGFIFFFLSYNILKWNFFYPVLVDTSSYFYSFAILYLFVRGRTKTLYLAAVAGEFLRESNFLVCALLVLFPMSPIPKVRLDRTHWTLVIPVVGALTVCIAYWHWQSGPSADLWKSPNTERYINLSLLFAVLYVTASTYVLFYGRSLFAPLKTNVRHLMVWGPILVATKVCLEWLIAKSTGGQTSLPLSVLADATIGTSLTLPLVFFVNHVIFFGPAILLAVYMWKCVADQVANFGLGYMGVVAVGLALAMKAESRQLAGFIPFIVLPLVITTPSWAIRERALVIIGSLSILLSHVWMRINTGADTIDFIYYLPGETYFSESQYIIWLCMVVGAAVVTYSVLIRAEPENAT